MENLKTAINLIREQLITIGSSTISFVNTNQNNRVVYIQITAISERKMLLKIENQQAVASTWFTHTTINLEHILSTLTTALLKCHGRLFNSNDDIKLTVVEPLSSQPLIATPYLIKSFENLCEYSKNMILLCGEEARFYHHRVFMNYAQDKIVAKILVD